MPGWAVNEARLRVRATRNDVYSESSTPVISCTSSTGTAFVPRAEAMLATTRELPPWLGVMMYETLSRSVRAVSKVMRSCRPVTSATVDAKALDRWMTTLSSGGVGDLLVSRKTRSREPRDSLWRISSTAPYHAASCRNRTQSGRDFLLDKIAKQCPIRSNFSRKSTYASIKRDLRASTGKSRGLRAQKQGSHSLLSYLHHFVW
jgi:hypothetical protein